jgi:hypothetical protein
MIEWVSKHTFAKPLANKLYCVDVSGIGGKNMPLPGELSGCLEHWEKSAEVSVSRTKLENALELFN